MEVTLCPHTYYLLASHVFLFSLMPGLAQVHDRLTAAGVPCNLLTGQEVRETPGATHISCTVEMAAGTTGERVTQPYDVSSRSPTCLQV
jgi:hypothetical protein